MQTTCLRAFLFGFLLPVIGLAAEGGGPPVQPWFRQSSAAGQADRAGRSCGERGRIVCGGRGHPTRRHDPGGRWALSAAAVF